MKKILIAFSSLLLFCASFQAEAQKKPLTHDVYDGWQSVAADFQVSGDGSIIAYRVAPQQGDGTLYVKNLRTGAELVIERGARFSMSQSADYAYCVIAAPYAETRQARIDKKKREDMPKDSVAWINLKTFAVEKIAGASSAKAGYDAFPYIFVSKEEKGGKKNILKVTTATGAIDTIRNFSDYTVSKNGEKLAVSFKKDKKDSTSVSAVVLYDFSTGIIDTLSRDRHEYANMVFNNEGDKIVFTATDQEEKTVGTPSHAIYLSSQPALAKKGRKPVAPAHFTTKRLVPQGVDGLPEGWIVSSASRPRFSNGSGRLVLSLNKRVPAKDTTVVDFEAAQLDIWRWDAQVLPPMDKAGSGMRRESLSAVINLDEPNRIVVLSQNPNDRVSMLSGADLDFAYASDSNPYVIESMWASERKVDYYRVNLRDGSRQPLEMAMRGSVMMSPKGNYALWFNPDNGEWYVWNLKTMEKTNLTAQTGVVFYDEETDTPSGYSPYGSPRWMGDEQYVLINDRYDIWRFSPDGGKPVCLTAGEGRRTKVQYRISDLYRENNPYLYENSNVLPVKGSVYAKAFDEEGSKNGYAIVNLASPKAPEGFLAEWSYTTAVKARNSSDIAFLKGNFRNPYDLYVTSDNWKSEKKLTSINPQQKDYLWGDAQLVHWTAYDGTPLKGLLYTPEGYDPNKKYPMMIYFYEKYSESLYNYFAPAPSRSTVNRTMFVSNGYVVFVPDIVYTIGHPGESAYNCICSGAEAMCEQFPFIDKSKMAIQGQSWGGYQTAYLVTRTDMFAAAGAGAPVGNMTSAYGGIRWESGNSRIGQYEHGQSRIGKTLWDEGGLDLYIENSPVFFAPKVKTPVLIMHNDADGAVPWYQGIEFFMSLRRLNKPAWLLEYNNEAHNLGERRNSKDLSIRLQQFFDYYLKGAPQPMWMKEGIPYSRKGNYFATEYAE